MSRKEEELARLRRDNANSNRGRIAQDCRDRLKRIAEKKFRTCFIAALSEFEMSFGPIVWGQGSAEDELTQEQLDNRALWKQVRKNILDKGNAQSRALGMEIDLHRVEFEGYRMNLKGNTDGQ